MKKFLNILVIALGLLTSEFANAKNVNTIEEDLPKATKVVNEITKEALKDIAIDKETVVYVTFTVNTDNEMAILNVRTTDKNIKQIVKNALNSRVVEDAGLTVGKPYTMSIRLKQ
ncbi:hypothetical protein [Flavobacterium sp.]|uniref:hypothetical protein n=1 Tax=Flavobacterium sp. TaxID=239 RepID=UPI003D09E69A